MGTRGEIYVRGSGTVIELWRHWDAHKKYMVPYFKLFAKYASWSVGGQRHWLTYPEDVAAMLIAFDYEVALASRLCLDSEKLARFLGLRPDIRPRGDMNDFEKVWILDLPEENQSDIFWRIRGFDYNGGDSKRMRDDIRRMKDAMLEQRLKKICDLLVKPENGGGCRICGYPGPLLLVEEPPLCIYCLARRVKIDDFVREQVEQILKIAPLISGP